MTWRTPAGILIAVTLVAAACGGSDASTGTGGPGGLGGESSTSSTASTQATTTGTHATTSSPASTSGTNSGTGGASVGGGSATNVGGSAANTGGANAGVGGAGSGTGGAGGAPACTTPNCGTCASCDTCAECACGAQVNQCLTDTAGPGDPAGCLTCSQALLSGSPNGVCPSNSADLVAVAQCTCQPTTCDAVCAQCPGNATTTTATTTATTTTASTGTGTICKTCSQMIATEDTSPNDVCPNGATTTNTTDFDALVFCACGNGGACAAACGTDICIGQPVNPTCQTCLVGVNGCQAPYNKCLADTTP